MSQRLAIECYCDTSKPAWPDFFGEKLTKDCRYADEEGHKKRLKILSLFSGAGGLDIGFHDAGFDVVESVELEKAFCETLKVNSTPGKRFEGLNVVCDDVRNYSPTFDYPIDFVIGGPPCQTFSAAGRRANGVLGTTDARGVLFREYVRILSELQPKGFLFENVYGIVGAQKGEAWREILQSFSEIGYRLYYRILDAADYGVAQHRERLIIVGLREGEFKFPRPLFGPDSLKKSGFYSAGVALSDIGKHDAPEPISGRYASLIPEIPPGLNYSFFTKEMGHPNPIFAWRSKFSDFMYKADPDVPVRTIKAQGGQYTGPFHWEGRHFSLAEYKRLQSFPDDYEICGGRQVAIQQIGNSVPPQLARILALSIRDQVFGHLIPIELTYLDDDEKLGFRQRKTQLTKEYRAKAKEALSAQKPECKKVSRETVSCDMSLQFDKFEAFLCESGKGNYSLKYCWGDNLTIDIRQGNAANKVVNLAISPSTDWSLPTQGIEIVGSGRDMSILTAMWKALERILIKEGLKADLVQLSNYYQYKSSLSIKIVLSKEDEEGRTLANITQGNATRKMLEAEKMAHALGIEVSSLTGIAKRLRQLGYEIRNHNTNRQIPRGCWLIPYEFPTLNPMSIQLKKEV